MSGSNSNLLHNFTHLLAGGTSLHALQRTGQAAVSRLVTLPAAGPAGIDGTKAAAGGGTIYRTTPTLRLGGSVPPSLNPNVRV